MSELDDYLSQKQAFEEARAVSAAKDYLRKLDDGQIRALKDYARNERFPIYQTFNATKVQMNELIDKEHQYRTIRLSIKAREQTKGWGEFS